jgi:hypothetical protein
MAKKLLLTLCLMSLVVPTMVRADVSLVQEWCEQVVEGSFDNIYVYFSIISTSYGPISSIVLQPEPSPAVEGCEIMACTAPTGWTCNQTADGGASWSANDPAHYIQAPFPAILSGFVVILQIMDGQFCCYNVGYVKPDGSQVNQEECFYCSLVPVEPSTWGAIKGLYSR